MREYIYFWSSWYMPLLNVGERVAKDLNLQTIDEFGIVGGLYVY